MISSQRVYDLVFLALRELGIVSLGDSIDSAVTQEALLVLNTIRAEYGITTKAYTPFDKTYTATSNHQNIRLGTSSVEGPGEIPQRPSDITGVILIMGDPDISPNVPLTIKPFAEYRNLPLTNIYAVPSTCYIDMGMPYRRIWLYPGLASGYSIRVVGSSYIEEYEFLDDPFIDPTEYFSLLYLSLAARLAPKYGQDVPQAVLAQLNSISKHIDARSFANALNGSMRNPLVSSGSSFNFLAGR